MKGEEETLHMLKRVVGYIRVSTQIQVEEGFSIEGQKQQLLAYCKTHNMEMVRLYIDEGISGKSLEGRHALNKLLEDAKENHFQEVIIWKVSRIARNVQDLLDIIKALDYQGIVLSSVSEGISTESVNGTFTIQMMGAVAELERKVIAENVQLGIHQKVREGWYRGASVLGYDIIPQKSCKANKLPTNLQINAQEAEIVKLIFKLYEEGKGYKAIANHLNSNLFKSKKGKAFSIGTIYKILNRRLYIGEIEYKINHQIEIIQGRHQPIISKEQWEKTRNRSQNKQESQMPSKVFTLSRLLKCPQCNRSMIGGSSVGRRGKKYYYYLCENHFNRGGTVCRAHSIPADRIEGEVYKGLHTWIRQPQIVEAVQRKVSTYDSVFKEKMKALNELDNKRERLEKRKQLLMKQFETNQLSKELFAKRINQTKDELVIIQKQGEELRQYLKDNMKTPISLKEIEEVFQNLVEILNKEEPKQIKELLRYIIHEIVVDDEKYLKNIAFRLKGETFYLNEEEDIQHAR